MSLLVHLGQLLNGKDNALNLVRLGLALMVIVSHTWPSGGFGPDPRFGDLTVGSWAVGGFFAISGYLVTASRVRLPLGQFAARRATRIFPGFWVCLVILAFGFAPIAALMRQVDYEVTAGISFVFSNLTTEMNLQAVGTELAALPYPDTWDASVWTLRFELTCYVFLGLILCLPFVRQNVEHSAGVAFAAITAANVTLAQVGVTRGTVLSDTLRLAAYFAAGARIWGIRNKIPSSGRWAAACFLMLVLVGLLGVADLYGPLPLAYLILTLGAWCPLRWGRTRDLSYGVYIYAWPIQQMLSLAGLNRFGPFWFMVITVVLVTPFAWLSWTFVERPALRIGRGSGVANRSKGRTYEHRDDAAEPLPVVPNQDLLGAPPVAASAQP